MPKESLSISVLVTSFNQRELIIQLVGQLLDQDYSHQDYEVIVMDDASTDGTPEWLSHHKDQRLNPVLSSERCGRAASRNKAIRAARGRVVIMIDGDHTVGRDFISSHARRHLEQECAVVGKSDYADHPDYRALNHYLNRGGAVKLSGQSKLPGRYFLTRVCSVPRSVLIDIDLFDEEFKVWGGEDLDLGMKLEDSGLPIYGAAEALAIHHHLRPLEELLENLFRYGREGIPLLLRRHPRLFQELNLDRLYSNPYSRNRYLSLTRLLYSAAMIEPIYRTVKYIARLLRRHHLPRLIFDYLHLRQYSRGYRDYLRETKDKPHGATD